MRRVNRRNSNRISARINIFNMSEEEIVDYLERMIRHYFYS
jgi:type II secretory pathway predicted ATPase ExeA